MLRSRSNQSGKVWESSNRPIIKSGRGQYANEAVNHQILASYWLECSLCDSRSTDDVDDVAGDGRHR